MKTFRYFAAKNAEVYEYSETETCIHCGRVAPSTQLKKSDTETPNTVCCLDCLRTGKSRIAHDTEIGYLEEGKLFQFDLETLEMVELDVPRDFPREAFEELMRTPEFRSHQGREFLVHCNDFMRYLGRWEPDDFRDAGGVPSREAYVKMADGDSDLWDATEKGRERNGKINPSSGESRWAYGAWCYVFECLHCGARRSTWDCG